MLILWVDTFVPDIYINAQIELKECAKQLGESPSQRRCAFVGRDAEAAVRTLQVSFVNAAPGLKAELDSVADDLTDHVEYLVSEGPLNAESRKASSDDIDKLRELVNEARELADEFQDDEVDLEEHQEWTTPTERFEAIGRAVYDHPDLMENPLEELFERKPNLEPPYGRLE